MALKGNNPYSTDFASRDIDHKLDPSTMMEIQKREELQTHIAPNALPYELSSVPDHFASMVDHGFQAAKILDSYLKVKDLKNYKKLLKLKKNTEKMVNYLINNVDPVLEQFTIGTKHASDDAMDEFLDKELY